MTLTTRQMSDAHEEHLAEVFGGHRTRGSGNQWKEQTDGRQNHREREFAFAWDGKSTRAQSITINRKDLDKLREQAHAERPMLPIRFYDDDRLRIFEDWDLVREDDMLELLAYVERLSLLWQEIEVLGDDPAAIMDAALREKAALLETEGERKALQLGAAIGVRRVIESMNLALATR